jgi:hypothetical protein
MCMLIRVTSTIAHVATNLVPISPSLVVTQRLQDI